MNQREIFLRHVAQTSIAPLALEIVRAEGAELYDSDGNAIIDLIGGISVANVGHRHPNVVNAIKEQLDAYLHIMVYGEFVQTPQVKYAEMLTRHLPAGLDCVYFTNSGAEAVEGAMKLAKRVTGRTNIIAFQNSYHGSTQGALSLIGDEYWRNSFRPLLPAIYHEQYNDFDMLERIDEQCACVVIEPVQAEAGVRAPSPEWIQAVRKRCKETGTLMILDEIQTGFGRTGKLWAFEHYGIEPDILLLGKALGGGMPLGAFISSRNYMLTLTDAPVLGHITTFGGHPVSCAAGLAAMNALLQEEMIRTVETKEKLFRILLHSPSIKAIHSFGLWMAVEFDSFDTNKKVIDECIRCGVLTDWFLFAPQCLRVSPPLMISDEQIRKACDVILSAIKKFA